MDVVTLFAIIVFVMAWVFWARTSKDEPLVRLFLAIMIGMGAAVGILGLVLRLTS